jgi:hypothetical protein
MAQGGEMSWRCTRLLCGKRSVVRPPRQMNFFKPDLLLAALLILSRNGHNSK